MFPTNLTFHPILIGGHKAICAPQFGIGGHVPPCSPPRRSAPECGADFGPLGPKIVEYLGADFQKMVDRGPIHDLWYVSISRTKEIEIELQRRKFKRSNGKNENFCKMDFYFISRPFFQKVAQNFRNGNCGLGRSESKYFFGGHTFSKNSHYI